MGTRSEMSMKDRRAAVIGALAAAAAVASLALATLGAQAPAASAVGNSLKTVWGEPDIQGIWANKVVVPLERPPAFGTREFKTDQEMAAARQDLIERAKRPGRDSRTVGGKPGIGTEKDVARAYNEHWFGDQSTTPGTRTSQIIDPPDGRIPSFTAEAQKRIAAKREFLDALLQGTSGGRPGPISPRRSEPSPDYNLDRINRADGPEDRGAPERCFGNELPVLLAAGTFGGVQRIVQTRGSVAFYYDIGQGQGFSRVVQVTDRPHVPSNIRLRHGDARARWEGDTLVVDVTNFTRKTNFRGSRENLHLVERFRRIDATTLEYKVTIEDPTTWTRPWTVVQELTKQSDKENLVFEGGCHEGNYGLLGMLANTRAAERLFKEGKGPNPDLQDNATGGAVE